MEYLVGCLPDQDFDALGRRYLSEKLRYDDLVWRPWLLSHIQIDGVDLLREAQSRGQGVILSFLHHGQYGSVFPSLARHGIRLNVAIAQWLYSQNGTSYHGRRWRQHRATITSGGAKVFAAPGSYPRMVELLHRGEVVAIASDMHGGTPVTWLGRNVSAASGAARLALETGAAVVPITAHDARPVERLQIETPLVGSNDDTVPNFLGKILSTHEPAIRAWPEAVEWPIRRFRPLSGEDIARFGFTKFSARFCA